ncbi:MAG: hypothetical protein FD131_1405 [Rhodocyclaceae bacterium]|nr:MAG: hypothetical protein FD131_1405 [Rhodocyclaceae bacterium]
MALVKATGSISNSSQIRPWQGLTLRRLAFGLACSLIAHIGFGLWVAQPVELALATLPTPPQRLEIRFLNNMQSIVQPKPILTYVPKVEPFTEPAAPISEDETPALPATATPSEETYLAPNDVEKMAFVVDVEELPLPKNELTPGGALYLKVLINESGTADKIDILTSTLPEEYAATLVGSFYQAKFSPAQMAGLPVKSWRVIEIRFDQPAPAAG